MKKNITISVDSIAYLNAKNYTKNISDYLSNCLENLANNSKIIDKDTNKKSKLDELNNSIQDLNIKKSILEMEIKRETEQEKEKQLKLVEDEKYKRWVCGVCKQQNFMDNIRCSGCNLPTKNDKKTTIIMLNNTEVQ